MKRPIKRGDFWYCPYNNAKGDIEPKNPKNCICPVKKGYCHGYNCVDLDQTNVYMAIPKHIIKWKEKISS